MNDFYFCLTTDEKCPMRLLKVWWHPPPFPQSAAINLTNNCLKLGRVSGLALFSKPHLTANGGAWCFTCLILWFSFDIAMLKSSTQLQFWCKTNVVFYWLRWPKSHPIWSLKLLIFNLPRFPAIRSVTPSFVNLTMYDEWKNSMLETPEKEWSFGLVLFDSNLALSLSKKSCKDWPMVLLLFCP